MCVEIAALHYYLYKIWSSDVQWLQKKEKYLTFKRSQLDVERMPENGKKNTFQVSNWNSLQCETYLIEKSKGGMIGMSVLAQSMTRWSVVSNWKIKICTLLVTLSSYVARQTWFSCIICDTWLWFSVWITIRPSCIVWTLNSVHRVTCVPPRVLYYIAIFYSLLASVLYIRFNSFSFLLWLLVDDRPHTRTRHGYRVWTVADIACKNRWRKNKLKLLMRFQTIYVQYTPICFWCVSHTDDFYLYIYSRTVSGICASLAIIKTNSDKQNEQQQPWPR